MRTIRRFFLCERAATSIEYGLIAALISVIVIGIVTTIGTRLRTKFGVISNALS